MAIFEDVFKGGSIMTGLAVGIGAAVIGPALLPALRPLAKMAIKAGVVAYDQGRVALAELNERTGDIVAEARAELDEARSAAHEGSASESRTS